MKKIALTGSIAMGKSEVARVFRDHDIPVFDADLEVHKLYDSDEGAALVAPFAPTSIDNNHVNRKILSQLVVDDPTLLTRLEPTIHAEIRRRRNEFIAEAQLQGHSLVLLDIPLLFETHGEADIDLVIVVSAPAAEQRGRALLRPGMTEQRFDHILSRQLPDQEKRKRADFILENTGSLEDLRQKTTDLIIKLRQQGSSDHA
jgi:dephospho-CoA kinase